MLCDFHLHTEFSADSSAPMKMQAKQAASLGMKEICITDHHDYDADSHGMRFLLDFERYIPAVLALKESCGKKIRINLGIELGLQSHVKSHLDAVAAGYPFDFIIGSCHFIDGCDPYYPDYFEGRGEREGYLRFFEVTLERVRNIDSFDVLGHLDYVVRYGQNKNRFYSYNTYRESIDPILKTLIEKGKGLECNTGGLKYGLGHPNPCEDVLKRYHELGGEILTVGSDAHEPQHIGYGFGLLPEMLKSCGFRYYTIFHGRKPEFLPLEIE